MSVSFLRIGTWRHTTIRIILKLREWLTYVWWSWDIMSDSRRFSFAFHQHKSKRGSQGRR